MTKKLADPGALLSYRIPPTQGCEKLPALEYIAQPIQFHNTKRHFMAVNYWLMKTEPTTYSIDDLAKDSKQTTCWEGVRNYQARNMLRDDIKKGDRVLFYHSACKEPAVVGTAVVTRSGYPDSFAFDPKSKYYDKKSDPENPTWFMVDIKLDKKFDSPVTLIQLREKAALKDMVLLRKGSRLSVQPVKKKEFDAVLKMAGG